MKGYVLITGATSGIGYEMAKLFALNGEKLIIVGRNEAKLEQIKKTLAKAEEVVSICSDLSQSHSAKEIYETVREKELEVDIVINNAGAGYVGEFTKATDEKIMELLTLNMTSVTLMTKYFAKDMMKKRSGQILNVASTGSYHPGPYTAVYYATKAYVLSLTEALTEELRPYGIAVSSLCPGATVTHFAEAAGRSNAGIAMDPRFVAAKAYKGLMKKKKLIIPGVQNKLFVKLPRSIAVKFIGGYQRALKEKQS